MSRWTVELVKQSLVAVGLLLLTFFAIWGLLELTAWVAQFNAALGVLTTFILIAVGIVVLEVAR